jgi:TonB family protein
METYFEYMLKSSLWITAFYLVYWLFLQKESFHEFKRFFLLAGIIASAIMPFVTVHYAMATVSHTSHIQIGNGYATIIGSDENSLSWKMIVSKGIMITYLSVFILLSVKIILHLTRIFGEIMKNKDKAKGEKIIFTDLKNAPFSFGRYIFMPKGLDTELEQKLILRHESIHVSQLHYIDLWLSKLFCIIHFYNPIVWLYAKAIQTNCEYIADYKTIEGTDYKKEYIGLLLKYSIGKGIYSIALHFSYPLTFKRITIMKQKKSGRLSLAKSLMVVPLAGLILAGYAQPHKTIASENFGNALDTITVVGYGDPSQMNQKKAVQKETTYKPVKYKDVVSIPDVMPVFPGEGRDAVVKYLAMNIKYPVEAQKKGIQGRVICQFIIDKKGNVSQVSILRGVDKDIDAEAIRVVKAMPQWKPGLEKGKPVNVLYTLPISFKLQ